MEVNKTEIISAYVYKKKRKKTYIHFTKILFQRIQSTVVTKKKCFEKIYLV